MGTGTLGNEGGEIRNVQTRWPGEMSAGTSPRNHSSFSTSMLHRSVEPVLAPLLKEERHGTVPNVVFPTGIDRRDDLGTSDRIDVYYGMADSRIGVARLDLPEYLSPGAPADRDGPMEGWQG